MSAAAIQQMADRVAGLMEERMGLGGRDLAAKLGRGGRLLPKKVRDGAQLLAVAAEKSKNPKLLGQIDMGEVADAYDACVRHLVTIDPSGRRKSYLSGVVGSVGFGVLALALAITLIWLLWGLF
jgi:hypothetical protein